MSSVSPWLVRALALGCALALACATTQDERAPQNPDDSCVDVCAEGLTCFGTTHMKFPKRTYPGHCALLPGRCGSDPDCGLGERCVRTTARIGLCAPSPRL